MSRQSSTEVQRFFGGGVTDQLLWDTSGNTQWAVE
jgi:hypothetical protein